MKRILNLIRKYSFLIVGLILILIGIYFIFPKTKTLTIVWPIEKPDFSYIYTENISRFIPGVYDSLFDYDNNLELSPNIANSWGKIESIEGITTWRFYINTNKKFTDKTKISLDDIIKSINTIKDISCEKSVLENAIDCTTSFSDDTFLRKITLTPITKDGLGKGEGTGEYKIIENTENFVKLQKKTKSLKVPYVKIIFTPFVYEIEEMLGQKNVDIVMNATDLDFPKNNYKKTDIPSLETFFLVPKIKSSESTLASEKTRNYLKEIFQEKISASKLNNKLMVSSQFFASNIVPKIEIDKEASNDTKIPDLLTIKTLPGLESIVTYLKSTTSSKINISAFFIKEEDIDKILNEEPKENELILLGWFFENASVTNFLNKIILPVCSNWPNGNEQEVCLSYLHKILMEKDSLSLKQQRLILQSLEYFLIKRAMILPLFETKTSVIHHKYIRFTPHPLNDLRFNNINNFRLF